MRISFRFISITNQLVIYLFAGLALLVAVLGVYQFQATRTSIYSQVVSEANNQLRTLGSFISSHPELLTTQDLQPIVLRMAGNIPNVRRVSIIDHSYLVLADSDPSQVGQVTNQTALIDVIRLQNEQGNFFTSNGQNYYRFSSPILGEYDPQSKSSVIGALSIEVQFGLVDIAVNRTSAASTLIAGVIGLLVILTLFAIVRQNIVLPVLKLAAAAQAAAAGDLNTPNIAPRADEIGQLGASFKSMVDNLRQTLGNLDRRASELATVADVGTATSTILDLDRLLQNVVDLTKERFNLYHAHIYLLDEAGETLVLARGAGEAGQQMKAQGLSIPLVREQSLVARAARERQGVTINDVTQAPDFLPNPLLPDTRSELAVPMIVGGNVIGVFDIQSEQVGRFTEADVNIQTTLAAQVAVSIQNVRSIEQSKAQADFESLVNFISQKIQRATTVEETLEAAVRELGLALGASRVQAQIGLHIAQVGITEEHNL